MSTKPDSPDPRSVGTSVDRAYGALREMAIEFSVKPGERLNEVELAGRLGMSRVPVREAMNRLVSEGLLTAVPNQGFSCRRLSASEVAWLYEVRGDLEAAAMTQVVAEASASDLQALRDGAEQARTAAGRVPAETLVERDEAFHLAFVHLAGNEERVRMLRGINARIRFVRRINLGLPERMCRSLDEHVLIAAALQRRDSVEAANLLRQHLRLSAEEATASVARGLARIYAEAVS